MPVKEMQEEPYADLAELVAPGIVWEQLSLSARRVEERTEKLARKGR
jgi:hypothetical protein